MSIELLRAHYGFSKMPFGKDVAPGATSSSAEQVVAISNAVGRVTLANAHRWTDLRSFQSFGFNW